MHRSRLLTACLVIGLTAGFTFGVSAQTSVRKATGETGVPATVQPTPHGTARAIGTIQYDNDTPFERDTTPDATVGNRFTPGSDPHDITSVSFRLAQNYGNSINASIWQPGTMDAVIMQRWLVTGIPATTVTGVVIQAPLPMAITGHSGSFLAGLHNTAYTGLGCPTNTNLNGTCDGVALTEGATLTGAAIHGIRVPLAGGVFTPTTLTVPIASVADLTANAIFRVTGDNLPVELMSFGIDEN